MAYSSFREVTQPNIRTLFGIALKAKDFRCFLRGSDTSNNQIQKTGAEAVFCAEISARF